MNIESNQNIVWRRGLELERSPGEQDLIDGRAEIVITGSVRLTEGASIYVANGKVMFSSGKSRPRF